MLTEIKQDTPVVHLALLQRGDNCLLAYSGAGGYQEIELVPDAPCGFFRYSTDKDARFFQYPAFHADAVLLVGGGELSAEEIAQRDRNQYIPHGETCVNSVQGVLLDGDTIYTSHLILRGLSCPNRGLDEKNYWMIASEYAKSTTRRDKNGVTQHE
jgi:hypothetical protein